MKREKPIFCRTLFCSHIPRPWGLLQTAHFSTSIPCPLSELYWVDRKQTSHVSQIWMTLKILQKYSKIRAKKITSKHLLFEIETRVRLEWTRIRLFETIMGCTRVKYEEVDWSTTSGREPSPNLTKPSRQHVFTLQITYMGWPFYMCGRKMTHFTRECVVWSNLSRRGFPDTLWCPHDFFLPRSIWAREV